MPAVLPQGKPVVVFASATAAGEQEIDCHGYTGIIVIHEISGSPVTGGYVEVELRPTPGVSGPVHPAPAGNSEWGLNVPGAAKTTTYAAIFRGVTSRVAVKLSVTDGTHKVTAIPIHV